MVHPRQRTQPQGSRLVCDSGVSMAWLGLRVTSTSFCCLEGSGDASGWGQGSSSQASGRGGRVTQDCGKNVGHPLSSREGLWQSFFFFFKPLKSSCIYLWKNRSLHLKPATCSKRYIYSIFLLLNIDANTLRKILIHGMSNVSKE